MGQSDRHGDEQQAEASLTVKAVAVGRNREDHQACQDGHQGIHQHHRQNRALQTGVGGGVGTQYGPDAHAETESEEGMKQRRLEALPGQILRMHCQDVIDGAVDPPVPGCQGKEHKHQHQGARHHHSQGPLQPFHHPLGRDPQHQQQKKDMPTHENPVCLGVGHQAGQNAGCLRLAGTGKPAERPEKHVSQGNGAEHSGERKHQERRQYAEPAHRHPGTGLLGTADQPVHGEDNAVTGIAANGSFGHHQRQGNQQQTGKVKQDEQAATMQAGQVGELPQIGKPHGSAHRGPEEG